MDKARRIAAWMIAIVLAAGYALSAYDKFRLAEYVAAQFAAFGYSIWFARLVGVLEAVGAALLLVPRLVIYGVLLIGVLMVGAIYSHLTSDFGSPFHASRNLALLVVLAALRWPEARLKIRD